MMSNEANAGHSAAVTAAPAKMTVPDPPAHAQLEIDGTGYFMASNGETVGPADIPVTLTVELGRVSLPLRRLADLKPGDVLELGRHAREPVELTSGGRTVARGELVQIESELGVRVTHVFL